jgi:hypothetical protein
MLEASCVGQAGRVSELSQKCDWLTTAAATEAAETWK